MLALLPHTPAVTLSVLLQRIGEWYAISRQWIIDLFSGARLGAVEITLLALVGLLLVLIIVQAVSYRARRRKWLAMKPLIDGAVESSSELILMASAEGTIRYSNPAAEAVFGITGGKQARKSENLIDVVARTADMQREDAARIWEAAVSQVQPRFQTHAFEENFRFGEALYAGRVIPVVEKKHDTLKSLIALFSPVEALTDEETPSPTVDPVTGLLNYIGFIEALEARLSSSQSPVCCSLLQVENLDMLTLEKGFTFRDELMRQLARRITTTLSEEWAAGCVADDTFAVASPAGSAREEWDAAVEKVFRQLSQHLIWEGQYIAPLIRVGSASSETAHTAKAMLDHALAQASAPQDEAAAAAMPVFSSEPEPEPEYEYEPEAEYQPEPETEPESEPEYEPAPADTQSGESPSAIKTQTASLCYQPQVYLKDGYLRGFHVSAVYENTPYGRLEGDALYARISERGLVVPYMNALLIKAMKAARSWQALYGKRLIVMCTLPPEWLAEPDLPAIVQDSLAESTLAGEYVEFFIPYTKRRPWSAEDSGPIDTLRALGVRFAADGLVGGALPLEAAVSPSFRTLVMGPSLLIQAAESEKYRALVGSIVQLGRKAGKDILAMGMNEPGDLAMLRQKECPIGQGMMTGGPSTEEDLAQILIDGIELPE